MASDAGVYRISDEIAIVQSVDFFTPIVDDPYEFGQIAAANSLGDLYAMGARPLTAMNIVCFPGKDVPKDVLKKILLGGIDKIHEAGAVLLGGHSVKDPEPKYGLAVTGIVHPERFITKGGARAGDRLILTKPLGTGILATVLKAGLLPDDLYKKMIRIMKTLNCKASLSMMEIGVSAATDITGFGLAAHAIEMAEASGVRIVIDAHKVPHMPEAVTYLMQGFIPEGDYANRNFCKERIKVEPGVKEGLLEILFDAQTSGGLLIAVPEERAGKLLVMLRDRGVEWCEEAGHIEEGPPGIVIRP